MLLPVSDFISKLHIPYSPHIIRAFKSKEDRLEKLLQNFEYFCLFQLLTL